MSDPIDLVLLKHMIRSVLMFEHELPWHIEYDWTVEVHDAAGNTVFKCMTKAEADRLIELGVQLKKESDETDQWLRQELGDDAEI